MSFINSLRKWSILDQSHLAWPYHRSNAEYAGPLNKTFRRWLETVMLLTTVAFGNVLAAGSILLNSIGSIFVWKSMPELWVGIVPLPRMAFRALSLTTGNLNVSTNNRARAG